MDGEIDRILFEDESIIQDDQAIGRTGFPNIQRLNPLIRGWTNYYRTVVSSAAFASLDRHLWQGLYKWAKFAHPHKPKGWIVRRYFGSFHPKRQDRWVFGDTATGLYVVKHAWTAIRRHRLVREAASPDNPAQTQYWAVRRRRTGHLDFAPLEGHETCVLEPPAKPF